MRRISAVLQTALGAAILLLPGSAPAQQRGPDVEAQKTAMKKLGFLVGQWEGPASYRRGPTPLKMTQHEDVQWMLDGLILTVHGRSTDAAGKTLFEAFATISYDTADNKYHFRAYNDGRYIDTELTVMEDGFAWGLNPPGLKIQNTMHHTAADDWQETTAVTMGERPSINSVEMLLKRVSK